MITLEAKEDVRPSRVVVIGSRGFIGSSVLSALAEERVRVAGIPSSEIDLTMPGSAGLLQDALDSHDTIVFVSALTPDRGRDRRTLIKNIVMVDHFLEALEKIGCSYLIYVSSDAVYSDDTGLIHEDSPCSPSSFHGMMHLIRERMLVEATSRKGIPLLRFRPCAVYGRGDTHNSYGPNRFVRSALEKKQITLSGQGEEKRDHLFIDDLTRLVARCIVRRATGVLNGATGKSVSFGEIASHIQSILGNRLSIESLPRENSITHRHFDVTELCRNFPLIQFTPIETRLNQMISAIG